MVSEAPTAEAVVRGPRTDRSEEYEALTGLVHELLGRACPPAVVRTAWDCDGELDGGLWSALCAAGLTGVCVPSEYDGLGLGEPGLAILAEAAGEAALPGPLLDSSLAALALAENGSDAHRAQWLPALAAGTATATLALGTDLAPNADIADVLVWASGTEVHVLDTSRFTARRRRSSDRCRRIFEVTVNADEQTLASRGSAASARLADQAALLAAATLCGISTQLVRMTTEYVRERRQFGQPVGAFQAVKHRLADGFVANTMAWPPCWDAAIGLAEHASDASCRVSVAKAFANDSAAAVNDHALQCHGGIGFSWEYDLHLWLKRGKALERAQGSSTFHRERIARTLFPAVDAH
jgi:alkylation response protein AidB-like acyl-CoA dehydrogenase